MGFFLFSGENVAEWKEGVLIFNDFSLFKWEI